MQLKPARKQLQVSAVENILYFQQPLISASGAAAQVVVATVGTTSVNVFGITCFK